MDIEKQVSDLRCCGNCQYSGFSLNKNGSPVFSCYSYNAASGLESCKKANPRCVCSRWESDDVDNEWRLKQQEYLLHIEP